MNHRDLEGKALLFSVLTALALLIGGIVELVPLIAVESNVPTIEAVKPYTPLEVMGRDIYVREGCYNCHSQMVRPFRAETERYGEYSKAGEFVYDHPFQWGSKRTGPDLHRIGGKYNDFWHYKHMIDPRSTSEGSIMPAYPWLGRRTLDFDSLPKHMGALAKVGVPYSDAEIDDSVAQAKDQAKGIAEGLAEFKVTITPDKQVIALIAYMQRLGTDIKAQEASQ